MSASEKKKEKTASEKNPYGYYGSGLVAPILTGIGDCVAAGATSRCVPRSFSGGDNPPQCSQYNNEDECPCQGDPAFDKDSQLCSDSKKNSTARNPDYNPVCYTDAGKDTTILTLGLAEYDPYYQEIDPCWLATDPSDAQCTCAILDMADGDSRNGICTGPNYANGTGGCYFKENGNGQPATSQDECENGNLVAKQFNPNSDYYDANANAKLSRKKTCVWYPKEWYNVTSSDDNKTKSVIPSVAALPDDHMCQNYAPSKLSFRVLGVNQQDTCSSITDEKECNRPGTNCAWQKKNDSEGVCAAVGTHALSQLCSNQSACLSNGHLPQTNGKCTSMVNGTPTSSNTSCTVDAQCNANKGEFCKGTPTFYSGCTNNNDCENIGEWFYDAVPLVQLITSTPAKKEYTCRSKKSFPWRGIVKGSKCVYLPKSTGDTEDAIGAGAASVIKSGLKMIGAGFLGDLIDPQKKVKDRISAAKDRISQTTQQMPLSAQGAQVKIDADLIKYVDTNARMAKLTEQIAEDHLQFLVEKNTLLISILAIVLFISVIFELI